MGLSSAYSTYGAPSEFGNLTNTTCYLGGDLGELNCTGSAKFDGNVTSSWLKGILTWAYLTGFPSTCTSGQYISALGDTLSCAAISITESQISNLKDYVEDAGDTMTGSLTLDDGVGESPRIYFINQLDNSSAIYEQTDGDLYISAAGGFELAGTSFRLTTLTNCEFIKSGATGILSCTDGEAALDVNSSDYWDALNSPLDIATLGNITLNNLTFTNLMNASGSIEWIMPEHIFDVDDADVETDLNTYVDIAGDTMTGNLDLGSKNITSIFSIFATDWTNVSITESQISDLQSYLTAETLWNANYSSRTGTGNVVFSTSPTFVTGITVPANSISDDELNEGLTFEWTNTHSFAAAGTFNDDLLFYDEIKPDGLLCSNTQILKKTGADNWDCAADAVNDPVYSEGTIQSVCTDCIGDSQLLFNTGQHLTTSSNVLFGDINFTGLIYGNGSQLTGITAGAVDSIIAGEGIDVSSATGDVTVSGELATTTNKGVASFNTNDFTVSSGAVSLKSKTSYLTIPGSAFHAIAPDTDPIDYSTTIGQVTAGTTVTHIVAPLQMQHGAVVTAVKVYGNAGSEGEYFRLRWSPLTGGVGNLMAQAYCNSEDTGINYATIDNVNRVYHINIENLESGDIIYGARIKYTTDYI